MNTDSPQLTTTTTPDFMTLFAWLRESLHLQSESCGHWASPIDLVCQTLAVKVANGDHLIPGYCNCCKYMPIVMGHCFSFYCCCNFEHSLNKWLLSWGLFLLALGSSFSHKEVCVHFMYTNLSCACIGPTLTAHAQHKLSKMKLWQLLASAFHLAFR